jgi:tRNA-splicing ligase RtcB (3'-phosphate/5'-hydroxy nucleic acid ligase)
MAVCEIKGEKVPIKLWTKAEAVEAQALGQLRNIARLPWVFKHVAAMPDVHFGKGATVGSVIAMKEAVSPAAVGVDIGCGMTAVKTSLRAGDLPDSLKALRNQVERDIPVGFHEHREAPTLEHTGDPETAAAIRKEAKALLSAFPTLSQQVRDRLEKAKKQLGTLGGGNHFIELCLDADQHVWLMLHSGSRNIGKTLAEIHIAAAKKLAHNANLPDPDLAVFLGRTPEMSAYRHDLEWAQRYAFLNRKIMLELYKGALRRFFPAVQFGEAISCHHNYVAEEVHFGRRVLVTRKGAISAAKGVMGIIPGSMGTRSFIVRGKGNPESFHSASHGAGRRMSRNQAKRTYSKADLEAQTRGVECRKDSGVVDEIPAAYKDIDEVMANQADLVEVVTELKQIMCVKG